MPQEIKKQNENIKRYSNGFSKVGSVLKKTAKEKKLQAALYKYQVIKSWEQTVCGFLEEAGRLSKAIDFQDGKLIIACLTKDMADKLYLFSKQIITALNELIGRKIVYAIFIEV
jgi:hypothetical protein